MILIYCKIKVGDFSFFSLFVGSSASFYRFLYIEEWKRVSERQHKSFIQRFAAENQKKRGCSLSVKSHSVCRGTLYWAHSEVFLLSTSRCLSPNVSVLAYAELLLKYWRLVKENNTQHKCHTESKRNKF